MRVLTLKEMNLVAGAGSGCSSGGSGNSYGGVTNPGGIAGDLIAIYEGLVAATSHVIERVAKAL